MSPLHAYTAARFAEIAAELSAEPAVEPTLQRIVDLAVANISGCDYAGITVRRGKKVETPAATDAVVNQLDQQQYDLQEGPCLSAVFEDDFYEIDDMSREQRWPRWAPKAAELGVLSSLSVRLDSPRGSVSALNLYSKTLSGYDQDDVLAAHIYASHAGVAFAASAEVEGQANAVQSRHTIGLAQGLLMQRYGLGQANAFQFMVRISQDANVKLREVAAKIIGEAEANGGQLP